jgi:CBS-domain-containing membrane protein
MLATIKDLLELTAADLMSREVVTVPEQMSLRCAAHLLLSAGISGVPVVDEEGRCTGALSATDFVRWVDNPEHPPCPPSSADEFLPEWQVEDLEEVPTDAVRSYMTADPVTAAPETSIGTLARQMMDAHVHRVLIVQDGRPVGVVSSTDILAALARADAEHNLYGRP